MPFGDKERRLLVAVLDSFGRITKKKLVEMKSLIDAYYYDHWRDDENLDIEYKMRSSFRGGFISV